MLDTFGNTLKEWRKLRRLSQLDLALSAQVSARHISFLETGRSRPSREMVLRLSEELQVPLGARNHLLDAAGLAPAYPVDSLAEDELAPLREAMERMLERHAPYPAMAIDRHWKLVSLNAPAAFMLSQTGISLGDSLIDALVENETLRGQLVNLEEVEALSLMRLRTELAHFGRDPVLESSVKALEARVKNHNVSLPDPLPAIIPARYKLGGQVLSFFSTMSQFATSGSVAMSELKIEMLFPSDQQTKEVVEALFGQLPSK
ncbi:DNA-binding protein, putative [Roseobacter sp. SK209-2-6]|uniref:MmyB family transcriptional regulator n=1 Tax=Roseobacter sp. SK209-2-6 TaxID=388739 RepID=UPI0000F3E809|nr:helix-turn-helix domain-containing protein [Roseobacter sp. SK209-2-6]EBA16129.1 DNA-binding protein, putative [Roseobacter sp. SK209-2-6]